MKHTNNFIFFASFLFFSSILCMEQNTLEANDNQRILCPAITNAITIIGNYLDLPEMSFLLRTCKTYHKIYQGIPESWCNNPSRINQNHVSKLQFGINRWLQQNPEKYIALPANQLLNVFIHNAKHKNKDMIEHLIDNEDDDLLARRLNILQFFQYNTDDDNKNIKNNIKAYRAIPNDNASYKYHILLSAAQENNYDALCVLLKNGANIYTEHDNGSTALHFAAQQGHSTIMQLLINKGLSVDSKNKFNFTPLFFAVSSGNKDAVHMLIINGANVNEIIGHNATAIHHASGYGYTDIVESLLNNDAYYNIGSSDGSTPLALASGHGHLSTIELLLDCGAIANIADNKGLTPLDWAIKKNHLNVVDLLKKNNAPRGEKCIIS